VASLKITLLIHSLFFYKGNLNGQKYIWTNFLRNELH